MGLLRLAGIKVEDLTNTAGYEEVKAKLEGISISITDKVFEYWTQNKNLDVEFDIRADPQDKPPFNIGNNLYIRIRNRRHRVSVAFSQRSKGFIWFFSFIVWFDSIKQQLNTMDDLVLLLDEPGLSLHALAQADFLRYIDDLSKNHQVLYTTHSPFMVHADRLHQARTVQDTDEAGTKVSSNISTSDPKTIFPLQAALGYTIAQNLFISTNNLLVEGPADLIYLKFFSSMLEKGNKERLRDDVTIVPVGGLDKLATFVALLGANQLELVVLHDFENKPDPRLESLVREKLIRDKHVLHYAMFRNGSNKVTSKTAATPAAFVSSDVEDLLAPDLYLKLFSGAYKAKLNGKEIKESDLPPGDRIIRRIGRYLDTNGILLRASGGFNHYLPAIHLASNPPSKVDAQTLARFEALFQAVNKLYTT
ncbi:MAG: AAA family ATPase [Pyrinomonadaceae bacterium MAG19_C2-C3]|nr:AAA family ATPase [Pyrinomonadaceae bacterium MAG19_C2-C3]